MSTPTTFKRAICRSANEVQSKADKNILVLIALNYAYEIEKDANIEDPAVTEYYEFLKDSLYSTDAVDTVVKSSDIQFPSDVSIRQSTPVMKSPVMKSPVMKESLIYEIKENPAPTSSTIDEHTEKYDGKYTRVSDEKYTEKYTRVSDDKNDGEHTEKYDGEYDGVSSKSTLNKKYSALTDYDWNTALSSSGPSKVVESENEVSRKVSEGEHKVSDGSRKVSPIPDEILYGDLSKYGVSNVERIKLISQIGDISSSTTNGYDQVYDIGFVPRSFRLGNRDVIQHVNNEDETTTSGSITPGSVTPTTQVNTTQVNTTQVNADHLEVASETDVPKANDIYTPVDEVQENIVQESVRDESEIEIHGEDVER